MDDMMWCAIHRYNNDTWMKNLCGIYHRTQDISLIVTLCRVEWLQYLFSKWVFPVSPWSELMIRYKFKLALAAIKMIWWWSPFHITLFYLIFIASSVTYNRIEYDLMHFLLLYMHFWIANDWRTQRPQESTKYCYQA